jgi:hypothetical protein
MKKVSSDLGSGFVVMKLNDEQKISLENLYLYLKEEKGYLKTRKENTKWFYIFSAVMVLIIYLDGFGKEKYETVVYIISAVWFIAFASMSEYFEWGHKGLKYVREAIADRHKVLAKYGVYAFLNDNNGLTVTQKDDDTFYDFQKLLDKDEPSPEQTQRFLNELEAKIKKEDLSNVIEFKKTQKKAGYIIYIQEIKRAKTVSKLEVKILKSDMTKLRQTLISKQLGELEKLYPLDYFNKFRFYLKSKNIPFITRLPFVEDKGHSLMDFKGDGVTHYYYEDENGELFEFPEEKLDLKIYSGSFEKKKVKLKIVK